MCSCSYSSENAPLNQHLKVIFTGTNLNIKYSHYPIEYLVGVWEETGFYRCHLNISVIEVANCFANKNCHNRDFSVMFNLKLRRSQLIKTVTNSIVYGNPEV